MRMRIVPIFALAVLAIPATAQARMLYIKQARTITTRIALAEIKRDRYYPNYVHTTTPACTRNTQHRVTCDYTIMHTTNRDDKYAPRHGDSCKRRVVVTRTGSNPPVGRRLNLDCYLHNPGEDYEP